MIRYRLVLWAARLWLGPLPLAIGDESRAREIPRWALWLAIDQDGAVYAYAEKPVFASCHWLPQSSDEGPPRFRRLCATGLDWTALDRNRLPDGNGCLYLLVEPLDRYVTPSRGASIWARIRRAVKGY